MEEAHQLCQAPGHGLIMVLHQQPVFRWCLTLKEPVKSTYDLSEPLLEGGDPGRQALEASLVCTFCEEMTIIPTPHGFCNLLEQFKAFS